MSHEDVSAVRRMTDNVYHRGPDAEGFLHADTVTMGMRRLRIIDRDTGDQPIYNTVCRSQRRSGQTVAVIFNGEIYNYQDLTRELRVQGHHFTTHSDTEALVHAYEEWGEDCVRHLRGMFAICVVDGRQTPGDVGPNVESSCLDGRNFRVDRVFLARDRLGIKPLYYYRNEGAVLFASEVRALLASGLVPRRLDHYGLQSYLAFGSVQEPLTSIEGVSSLPPGHTLTINPEQESLEPHRYWDLPTNSDDRWGPEMATGDELSERLGELLTECVSLRLISEVPLGAFLSGGIDSGAVVSLMKRAGAETPKTFNITFNEPEFSEATLARATATRSGTDHHEILVTPEEVLTELPQALGAVDQPSVDGFNTYYVSRAAKQAGLTVALSGLGGDEVFAGYEGFLNVPRMSRLQSGWGPMPRPLKRLTAGVWSTFAGSSDRGRKIAAFVAGDNYLDHPYFISRMLFTPRQMDSLCQPYLRMLASDNPWRERLATELDVAKGLDPINAVSYLELKNYLGSTLLRDTDCMSMAHSLEVRVPLIDHKLVEFVMRLPGRLKIDRGTPKHLLVKALDGALSPEVVHQTKSTFTFPWDRWLRNELRGEVEGALRELPRDLVGLLDRDGVEKVWQQFLDGRTSWSRPWSLYVLSKWVGRELA